MHIANVAIDSFPWRAPHCGQIKLNYSTVALTVTMHGRDSCQCIYHTVSILDKHCLYKDEQEAILRSTMHTWRSQQHQRWLSTSPNSWGRSFQGASHSASTVTVSEYGEIKDDDCSARSFLRVSNTGGPDDGQEALVVDRQCKQQHWKAPTNGTVGFDNRDQYIHNGIGHFQSGGASVRR